MECDEAAAGGQERQDRREIAVADEGFARIARDLCVEKRQHLRAPVPAAHANHAGNRWIGPGIVNRPGANLR